MKLTKDLIGKKVRCSDWKKTRYFCITAQNASGMFEGVLEDGRYTDFWGEVDNWEFYSEEPTNDKSSNVDHPAHYNKHPSGIECIQIAEHMIFNIGNAIKYLWRADYKNGIEDLQKALWYVRREIERRGKLPKYSCQVVGSPDEPMRSKHKTVLHDFTGGGIDDSK